MIEAEEDLEKANNHPISQKKLDANRRNAQLSTGPKTKEGKKHSRRNALKHGILADKLLIKDGLGAENAAALERFFLALHRDRAPEGELEEVLVEQIGSCYWRLGRALQAEAGSIRRAHLPSMDFDEVVNPRRAEIIDHLSLPAGEDLDRILRYEGSIQRQLAFSINLLERLQRSRKGEHVPAPVSLQVSRDE
jgi:hypothetical protein